MLRRLAALAATLVVIALPSTASAGTTPDPMAGAPAVGDCFDITLAQAMKDSLSKDPVDCADDHTAVVTAVDKLPARLDWDSSQAAIGRVVGKACSAAFDDRFHYDTLRFYRSQYQTWVFLPTSAQQDAGARWFDCMVSVRHDRGLIDLPHSLPRLTAKLPDVVARCVTAKYKYTNCADSHVWRSSYAFYATGKATDRNIDAAANRVCPRHVTSRRWLRSAWDIDGKRFVVGCYSKTRS